MPCDLWFALLAAGAVVGVGVVIGLAVCGLITDKV